MSQKCTFSRPFTVFLRKLQKIRRSLDCKVSLRVESSRVEEARALPLFRLSHFFKTTISHLEVWVKANFKQDLT
jgi:hypothetical protein